MATATATALEVPAASNKTEIPWPQNLKNEPRKTEKKERNSIKNCGQKMDALSGSQFINKNCDPENGSIFWPPLWLEVLKKVRRKKGKLGTSIFVSRWPLKSARYGVLQRAA